MVSSSFWIRNELLCTFRSQIFCRRWRRDCLRRSTSSIGRSRILVLRCTCVTIHLESVCKGLNYGIYFLLFEGMISSALLIYSVLSKVIFSQLSSFSTLLIDYYNFDHLNYTVILYILITNIMNFDHKDYEYWLYECSYHIIFIDWWIHKAH